MAWEGWFHEEECVICNVAKEMRLLASLSASMLNSLLRFSLSVFFVVIAGCTQYATVSQTRPQFRPLRALVGSLVLAQQSLQKARGEEKRAPIVALGEYLTAAEAAQRELLAHPDNIAARDTYNFAVARVLGLTQDANLDPWTKPINVPTASGGFVLKHKPDPRPQWNPTLYTFTPADQFDVKGSYVTKRNTKEGIGAPSVAVGRSFNENADRDFAIPRVFYGVTVVIHFSGRTAVIALEDPLATDTVELEGHRFPLAADFTVPLAVLLASAKPQKMELSRLLHPAKYAETARISRLEPYDPKKTVVLVVHGLMDSPATWTPMINELRSHSAIRRNYQFWFYSYPSGYPYPYSAAILRHKLDAIEKRYPLGNRKMVVIGHSMGGCITRLLITDADEKIWVSLFEKMPNEVSLSSESRKVLSDALIFKHRTEIGRVIFISAPLRGSELARNWLGRVGARLITAPNLFLRVGREALSMSVFRQEDLKLNSLPNSVDTLAPNNRFVKAVDAIPLYSGIPYHVICADRGKGGNRDKTPPVMSDGFVPYWSSHLEGAQSELIVPSGHSSHQNQHTISEVLRILEAHSRR